METTLTLQDLRDYYTQYLLTLDNYEELTIEKITQLNLNQSILSAFLSFVTKRLDPRLPIQFDSEASALAFVKAMGYTSRKEVEGRVEWHHVLDFDRESYKSFSIIKDEEKWTLKENPLKKT